MNTAKKHPHGQSPEDYSPKTRPSIISMMDHMKDKKQETICQKVNDACLIVDREAMNVVGIKIRFSGENAGRLTAYGINSDEDVAKKYIQNGTIPLLAKLLHMDNPHVYGFRTNIVGPGMYDFVIGVQVDSLEDLPMHLPENATTLSCPASRYAKFNIHQPKEDGSVIYEDRMAADTYFVSDFLKDTPYAYNKSSLSFTTYDMTGNLLTKYEPVKVPTDEQDRYDHVSLNVVSTPDILCACLVGTGESVIFSYFERQEEVFTLDCAKAYNDDYYGFPLPPDADGKQLSCFGSRVSSYEGIPDTLETKTIPGGIYLHISQLECNGDNPVISFDVAFNHLETMFFKDHPMYEKDNSRELFVRFRQGNSASVFIPLTYLG